MFEVKASLHMGHIASSLDSSFDVDTEGRVSARDERRLVRTAQLTRVIRGYSEALLAIPEALATNCGLPTLVTIADLRTIHETSDSADTGIDCRAGTLAPMTEGGVVELLEGKRAQIALATEAAISILRIDAIHTV